MHIIHTLELCQNHNSCVQDDAIMWSRFPRSCPRNF